MSKESLGRQLRSLRGSTPKKPRVVFRDDPPEQYSFSDNDDDGGGDSLDIGPYFSEADKSDTSNSSGGLTTKTKLIILAVASAVVGVGVYVKQSPPVDLPPEELQQRQATARIYALIAAGGTAALIGYALFWRKVL